VRQMPLLPTARLPWALAALDRSVAQLAEPTDAPALFDSALEDHVDSTSVLDRDALADARYASADQTQFGSAHHGRREEHRGPGLRSDGAKPKRAAGSPQAGNLRRGRRGKLRPHPQAEAVLASCVAPLEGQGCAGQGCDDQARLNEQASPAATARRAPKTKIVHDSHLTPRIMPAKRHGVSQPTPISPTHPSARAVTTTRAWIRPEP
jgi:hypothetical protein